jgi:hypothetical protein
MHELLRVLDRHRGHVMLRDLKPFFRLRAKSRDLRGSVWYLGHHITLLIS